MNFLSYDSPFMTGCRRLIDYILLGMLWMLASIPIITFGAATTAMFYTAENCIHKDEGKFFSTFWKCFRREFKQATLLGLLHLGVLALLVLDLLVLRTIEVHQVLLILMFIAFLFVFSWLQLWFGYLSKFQDTIRVLLANTFRMTMASFGRALLLAVLAVAALGGAMVAILMISPIVLLIPGIYTMLAGMVLRKLFTKFLPPQPETDVAEVA